MRKVGLIMILMIFLFGFMGFVHAADNSQVKSENPEEQGFFQKIIEFLRSMFSGNPNTSTISNKGATETKPHSGNLSVSSGKVTSEEESTSNVSFDKSRGKTRNENSESVNSSQENRKDSKEENLNEDDSQDQNGSIEKIEEVKSQIDTSEKRLAEKIVSGGYNIPYIERDENKWEHNNHWNYVVTVINTKGSEGLDDMPQKGNFDLDMGSDVGNEINPLISEHYPDSEIWVTIIHSGGQDVGIVCTDSIPELSHGGCAEQRDFKSRYQNYYFSSLGGLEKNENSDDTEEQETEEKTLDGTLIKTINAHDSKITDMEISGDKIYTSSWDKSIKIWDLDLNLLHTIQTNSNINSIEVTEQGIYSNFYNDSLETDGWSGSNTLLLWSESGEILNTFEISNTNIGDIKSSNDFVYVGSGIPYESSSDIYVWNSSGNLIDNFGDGDSYTLEIEIDENYAYVFYSSENLVINKYDLNSGELFINFNEVEDTIGEIALDENYLYAGDASGKIYVWDKNEGNLIKEFNNARKKGVTSLYTDKDYLYVSSGEYINIYRNSFESNTTINELYINKEFDNLNSIKDFVGNKDYFYTASEDGRIKKWKK